MSKAIPTQIQPVSHEDLKRCVALFNRESHALVGEEEFTEADVHAEWSSPGFDPREDARLVEGAGGTVIGYVELWHDEKPYVRPTAWMSIDPAVSDDAPATELLRWAKSRAELSLTKAPADAMVTLQAAALEQDPAGIRRLTAFGMREQRRYYRMEIELPKEVKAPAAPDGYAIRTMRPGEERATFDAVDTAFDDHYGRPRETDPEEQFAQWKHYYVDDDEFDPELAFVAVSTAGEIAGASICFPRHGPQTSRGWVEQLGVRRDHRERGLGEALLKASFHGFSQKGKTSAGLGVDATSLTGATRLYEKCGMHVVRTIISFERELRPGVDYRRQ